MSGSPIPRLITSIPSSRFSSIRRSSSANMYGGIASSRAEGAVRSRFAVPFSIAGTLGAAAPQSTSPSARVNRSLNSPAKTGSAHPVSRTSRSSLTSTWSWPPSS